MIEQASSYDEVLARFRWRIPDRFNIGVAVTSAHAGRNGDALIFDNGDGTVERYGFRDLDRLSNRAANMLVDAGLRRGDRVGVFLSQSPEAAIAHAAIYKAGAIAMPLFVLFGPDALEYRLNDSGARFLFTDIAGMEKIKGIRDNLPRLDGVFVAGADTDGSDWTALHPALDRAADAFTAVDTAADDPAVIIYTSGTTGNPKGALHAHRTLLGHLPGVEFPQEFFPQEDDLFWTPADWAWIGGLLDVLLPSLYHGKPVLARRMAKFDPEEAFALMARHDVRNAFLPPTALKLMRQVPDPGSRHAYAMRSIGSGGESLGEELLEWGRRTFGLTINEFYGQTECNLVVGNCASIMPAHPGSIGRAIPGHRVAVVDDDGNEVSPGTAGHIAIARPDPVMFLEYWNRPEATAEKFIGDWLITGDTGTMDEEGYFRFQGRADDVITSSGYRIGPAEVEDCLMKHPAVALAAVIGVPDPDRTEIVKAFVVPAEGAVSGGALARDIQDFVKARLAAHEYPRAVEFVTELPMTTTGKIMRRELRAREAAGQKR
jgi:acetyl-CoA synthetase